MARKKAEKYLGNSELVEGFQMLFKEYLGEDASEVAVDDLTDAATAKVSFVFKRPLRADVEAAYKQAAEIQKEVEAMLADLRSGGDNAFLPEGLIEGEFREVTE